MCLNVTALFRKRMLHFSKSKMEAAIHSRMRSEKEVRTPKLSLYGTWDTCVHIVKEDLKKKKKSVKGSPVILDQHRKRPS